MNSFIDIVNLLIGTALVAFLPVCFVAETMPKLNGWRNSHLFLPSSFRVFSHPRAPLTVPLPVISSFSEREPGGP